MLLEQLVRESLNLPPGADTGDLASLASLTIFSVLLDTYCGSVLHHRPSRLKGALKSGLVAGGPPWHLKRRQRELDQCRHLCKLQTGYRPRAC